MEFRPIPRASGAFQQPITAEQVVAMCRRAFGERTSVVSVVELGNGMYNNTYKVDIGAEAPVILRVAPEPARQSRLEHELMRNEHASIPFLAPIAPLLPQTLMADFTHTVIGRDYLFQSMLDGVPAPDGLGAYPRSTWASFFRQLGSIVAQIHAVRGRRFGPVAGPSYPTWSQAVTATLTNAATDMEAAGLDATDIHKVAGLAEKHRAVLDQITDPRLLHGDLWTVNVMIDPDAAEPRITGVFDCDRTSWGDPAADWSLFMASRRPDTERDTFWETYPPQATDPEPRIRALIYQAMHTAALRLERHRRRAANVADTYNDIANLLAELRQ